MKLILFDIDGTLTKTHGHVDAFMHALKAVYGVYVEWPGWVTGMVDREIIMKAMLEAGLEKQEILDKMEACMKEMADYYERTVKDTNVELCSGVRELLDELKERGFLLGIVSGNVERIAKAKLGKAGVWDYFSLGGFGSESEDRAELVRLAVERAGRLGFKGDGVFLVGDTFMDVEAGKRAGVHTVAVATGHTSMEDLRKTGPDLLLNSLAEKERFLEVVG